MSRLIVTPELRKLLGNPIQSVELVDEAGTVLATVQPKIDLSQWDLTEPSISQEELQSREKSNKWHTTAEVMAYLKSR